MRDMTTVSWMRGKMRHVQYAEEGGKELKGGREKFDKNLEEFDKFCCLFTASGG